MTIKYFQVNAKIGKQKISWEAQNLAMKSARMFPEIEAETKNLDL
jgi:hypothetical protein